MCQFTRTKMPSINMSFFGTHIFFFMHGDIVFYFLGKSPGLRSVYGQDLFTSQYAVGGIQGGIQVYPYTYIQGGIQRYCIEVFYIEVYREVFPISIYIYMYIYISVFPIYIQGEATAPVPLSFLWSIFIKEFSEKTRKKALFLGKRPSPF